jgi:hypothetical protein
MILHSMGYKLTFNYRIFFCHSLKLEGNTTPFHLGLYTHARERFDLSTPKLVNDLL